MFDLLWLASQHLLLLLLLQAAADCAEVSFPQ
jgi:hypothetical protein